jgi:hypothetical protein
VRGRSTYVTSLVQADDHRNLDFAAWHGPFCIRDCHGLPVAVHHLVMLPLYSLSLVADAATASLFSSHLVNPHAKLAPPSSRVQNSIFQTSI